MEPDSRLVVLLFLFGEGVWFTAAAAVDEVIIVDVDAGLADRLERVRAMITAVPRVSTEEVM